MGRVLRAQLVGQDLTASRCQINASTAVLWLRMMQEGPPAGAQLGGRGRSAVSSSASTASTEQGLFFFLVFLFFLGFFAPDGGKQFGFLA